MTTKIQIVVHGEQPAFLQWLDDLVTRSPLPIADASAVTGVLMRPPALVATQAVRTAPSPRLLVLDHAAGCACCMGGPVLVQALVRALRVRPSWLWLATSGHAGERIESVVFHEPGLAKYLRPLAPLVWRSPAASDDPNLESRWPSARILVASPPDDSHVAGGQGCPADASDVDPASGVNRRSLAEEHEGRRTTRKTDVDVRSIADLSALEALCHP